MTILVDATTLIALGTMGELELLAAFDRDLIVCPAVRAEVTTEPARTNVERFLEADRVRTAVPADEHVDRARTLLDEDELSGDVQLVASILERADWDPSVVLASDDRRLRAVAGGLDARVTGTIGVLVRAVHEGLEAGTARELVRRLDAHGLHMTGELRERADELIDDAAS